MRSQSDDDYGILKDILKGRWGAWKGPFILLQECAFPILSMVNFGELFMLAAIDKVTSCIDPAARISIFRSPLPK